MKLIKPTAELWQQGTDMDAIWSHIARCVRVCYQSTPKDPNENDEAFVKRVILSHEPANSVANHLAMLEHGTIYLTFLKFHHTDDYDFYKNNKYSKIVYKKNEKYISNSVAYITTNLRVLIENNRLNDLKWLSEPTWHEHRYTFCFTTNIGVSREFNRHRVNSIAEESTRYCNYSKDKFGNEITFVVPAWYNGPVGKVTLGIRPNVYDEENKRWSLTAQEYFYLNSLSEAEDNYLCLTRMGWIPQQAREVLPLATKTQLVHTAFESDWKHFIALRSEGVSGKPHPNAKLLGDQVKDILENINNY